MSNKSMAWALSKTSPGITERAIAESLRFSARFEAVTTTSSRKPFCSCAQTLPAEMAITAANNALRRKSELLFESLLVTILNIISPFSAPFMASIILLFNESWPLTGTSAVHVNFLIQQCFIEH
jgi:hypothetical protein